MNVRVHNWAGFAEAPVRPEVRVFPVYRDGTISKIRRAGDLRWQHLGYPDDIMSYTIAKR